MGRLRRKKRHRKVTTRLPKAPASDPEVGTPCTKGEEQYSSCTNSCDEALSRYGGECVTPRGEKHRSPLPDEMEVTRKLSCLNFSALPCSSFASFIPSSPPPIDLSSSMGFEVLSDLDLEMASGTQLDVLPTLSDNAEGMEAHYRYARKRPSRRKSNRRTKRFRCISTRDSSHGNTAAMATPHPLGMAPQPSESGGAWSVESPRVLQARSVRKLKRPQADDSLLCCFSDTSAVFDVDTPPVVSNQTMEWVETTPPASTAVMGAELICEDTLPNESELSSTTSDSGCEGDDEESSMEGPVIPMVARLPGHMCMPRPPVFMGGGDWCSQDQRFQHILDGAFPLLTPAGQHKVGQVCNSLAEFEFKHPGRFSICRRGSGNNGGRGGGNNGGRGGGNDGGLGGGNDGGCGSGNDGGRGRKKRCKRGELTSPLTLKDINQQMVAFIQDTSPDVLELRFSFVSRALCKTIAELAHVYQLECVVEQKRRLPVASPMLKKTCHSRLARRDQVEPILRKHGQDCVALTMLNTNSPSHVSRTSYHSHPSDVGHSPKPPCHAGHPPKPPCCVVVGGVHQPLDSGSLGGRMLQGMGWLPGTGLGAKEDGITSPVRAHIRNKHAGLGFVGHH